LYIYGLEIGSFDSIKNNAPNSKKQETYVNMEVRNFISIVFKMNVVKIRIYNLKKDWIATTKQLTNN
jgi:hypothetical protein